MTSFPYEGRVRGRVRAISTAIQPPLDPLLHKEGKRLDNFLIHEFGGR
jgi:hypothetical protein